MQPLVSHSGNSFLEVGIFEKREKILFFSLPFVALMALRSQHFSGVLHFCYLFPLASWGVQADRRILVPW